MDHNLQHLTGVADTVNALKESVRVGYPMDLVFVRGLECAMPRFGGRASARDFASDIFFTSPRSVGLLFVNFAINIAFAH